MSESLIERLADISIKIFAIGTVNGIKKLEDLSAELNSLSADIAQRDWHTGTPTEKGWYVYEASSGGCYFTYIVDDEASLHFLANTNFVRRWQKIKETD